MSFVTQKTCSPRSSRCCAACSRNSAAASPSRRGFRSFRYAEAMRKYGIDKPDLRNPIRMQGVSDAFRGSGFKIFANIIAGDPKVAGLVGSRQGRRESRVLRPDELMGAGRGPARAWLHFLARRRGGRCRSAGQEPRSGPDQTIPDQLEIGVGDAGFLWRAGRRLREVRRPARTNVGEELGLIAKDRFEFCWIVDFPMYEWNEEEKKIDFSHNPFSMPNLPVEDFSRSTPTTKTRSSASRQFNTTLSATA